MKTTILFFLILFYTFTSISQTFVPDDAFEQKLINLGYDSGPLDDFVPTANINTVTNLDVSNSSISDLTGIEGFSALETLDCGFNQITSLDLSGLTALEVLNCNYNNLNTLNVSQNTNLTTLICFYNYQLTTLDVSQNTLLTKLMCTQNLISNLDVSNNTNLTTLHTGFNLLTTLDLSLNTSLTDLYCDYNQLTTLNVKNGNNTNVTAFSALNNPNLTCIEVDDAVYSTTNWLNIDAQTSYSEDCILGGADVEKLELRIYPNPASETLVVLSENSIITNYRIIDLQGKLIVSEVLSNNMIPVSGLQSGIYFLQLTDSENNIQLLKFIKR